MVCCHCQELQELAKSHPNVHVLPLGELDCHVTLNKIRELLSEVNY